MTHHLVDSKGKSVPITPVSRKGFKAWLKAQPTGVRQWVDGHHFEPKQGDFLVLPAPRGGLGGVLLAVGDGADIWSWGDLPSRLPAGRYRIAGNLTAEAANAAALGWGLGSYRFIRYRKASGKLADLVWPDGADRARVVNAIEATWLVRDLVNTPAEDMGPAELADAARDIAKQHKANFRVTVGDELLKKGYRTIHAVGRASTRPPRLIDLRWGNRGPKLTLVGKGVCFDSGGYDLKTAQGMQGMKKDMGGAAHVLGLGRMIMAANLPVRLRVLVPAVENLVSGNAYKPMDIIKTFKGLTVEIGNTDAEGRLILCDALAEADGENPDLIVDFATLTGAARVALGTDLPALFCNDDATAERLLAAGRAVDDPLWRLPLHKPYAKQLKSKIADMNNISSGGQGGAITAALFLNAFVAETTPWIHIDLMAANNSHRPGRPEGGEAMALRALFAMVEGWLADKPAGKKAGGGKKR
ncbi:MAG: leucyl aminopeptidase family protein [Dongiaceae bacterium]